MAGPRAFISFEMEDCWARDFLAQQAKDDKNDVLFIVHPVKRQFDSSWKTQCRERIAKTKGTLVLIGETTWKSDAVLWEIAETVRQGNFIFGLQISRDKIYPVPAELPVANVIRCDLSRSRSGLRRGFRHHVSL